MGSKVLKNTCLACILTRGRRGSPVDSSPAPCVWPALWRAVLAVLAVLQPVRWAGSGPGGCDTQVSARGHHGAHGDGGQREHGALHRAQVWHPASGRRLPRHGGKGVEHAHQGLPDGTGQVESAR